MICYDMFLHTHMILKNQIHDHLNFFLSEIVCYIEGNFLSWLISSVQVCLMFYTFQQQIGVAEDLFGGKDRKNAPEQ
jgi:hypothetical protein